MVELRDIPNLVSFFVGKEVDWNDEPKVSTIAP